MYLCVYHDGGDDVPSADPRSNNKRFWIASG